jgi:3-isopropylmalate/(R)-2-methylmalate dehydratase large subunit
VKIPKKKELLELQKKYRTDKKIAEVYGVPSRLVAYWRSKKNIGPYGFSKYSREKIVDLWERYGDDRLAGAELGISGPGFRQWRIKYGIKKKPAQLKMEQLELDLRDTYRKSRNFRRETFIRKVLAKKSGLKSVEEGQIINVQPDLAVSIDDTGEVINQFKQIGLPKIWDHSKIAIILNYWTQNGLDKIADVHKIIREFVKKHRIERFFDIGWGISQQIVLEEGLILPGRLVYATDIHATSYGCIGALSTCISPLEMAVVWASGRIWLKVPETIKVVIKGLPGRGVLVKDIILRLSRDLRFEEANYKALEFYGDAVSTMTVSQRLTLTSFSMEVGAKSAVVPFDEVCQRYLKRITKEKFSPIVADSNAKYENEIEVDVSYLTPQVARPDNIGYVKPVEDVAGKKIDQVILNGCTCGQLDDLETVASILRGRRIHRDTRMVIVPASRKTYLEAIDKGYIRSLVGSGCVVLNPGCGSCISAHKEMLATDERVLTTNNRDFFWNTDFKNLEVYLASPATAAATALEGAIVDPRKYLL